MRLDFADAVLARLRAMRVRRSTPAPDATCDVTFCGGGCFTMHARRPA